MRRIDRERKVTSHDELDRLPSALILSSLTTLLVACGGKEEVVQAPPPKPKPVITQPEPVEVEVKQLSGSELIAKVNLDPRLILRTTWPAPSKSVKKC